MLRHLLIALSAIALLSHPAQKSSAGGLEIGPGHKGLAIGNVPEFTGLRINFRDTNLVRADGVNITFWRSGDQASGRVRGLALGVFGPEADVISGLSVGLVGVAAQEQLRGIAMGGLGMGVGQDFKGIAMGGLGMGVGQDVTGLAIGGLGMGVGEDATGILIGGLGAGIGEDFKGVGIGGLGFGVGGSAKGFMAGGLGFGVGEDFRGIALAGLGFGVGGTMEGLAVSGMGMGCHATRGVTVAPVMIRGKEMWGVSVSAYNRFDDQMEGLAIGLLNITEELHGVQLGVLNIVWDNPKPRRILPIINWGG